MRTQAVVWIDHAEARVVPLATGARDATTVLASPHHMHRHPKGRGEAREHPDDAKRYFTEVEQALTAFDEVLLLGPGEAKRELYHHIEGHHPTLRGHIAGIETADRLSDGQIAARALDYFSARDRMR